MSATLSQRLRRRPVDVLFGEDDDILSVVSPVLPPAENQRNDKMDNPRFVVGPPHAPLIVAPPPLLVDAGSAAFPIAEEAQSGSGFEQAVESNDLSAQEDPDSHGPMPEEYNSLSSMIEALYETTAEEAKDSPGLTEYCLKILRESRSALLRDDYAEAEYKAEQVRTRLLQALASQESGRTWGVKLTWAWLLFVGLLATTTILLPSYFQILPPEQASRFAAILLPYGRFLPSFVPPIRALSLGTLGAVSVALYNLSYFLRTRSFDPAYNGDYRLSPLKGLAVGAMIAFLSGIGFIAAPGALGVPRWFGVFGGEHLVMYALAFLFGMACEQVFDLLRGALASYARDPQRKRRVRMPQIT